MKLYFLLISVMFLTGCGSRTLDDFQEEGRGIIRTLIQDLKSIQTRQELIAASGRLQRQFDRLASIMIAAEQFSGSHPEMDGEAWSDHDLSDQLRIELNRLYRLEGGRQIIEKCQEKALYRLQLVQSF